MSKTIYPILPDNDVPPLILTGIGETDGVRAVDCKKGETSALFVITTGGEGDIIADGKTFRQKRNGVAFIPAGVPYSFVPEGADWSVLWLTVGGSVSETLLRDTGFAEPLFVGDADTEESINLHGQLIGCAEKTLPDPRIVSTLLYSFILAARGAVSPRDGEKYNCNITESVRHIDTHYGENITLERLAAISGVSLQHFCRVFRSKLGMRPMEYLARRRVAQAKILLGETDGKIGDIAKSVGFEDSNYFGITFRKIEGVSPSEYRKERGISEK